MVRAMRLHVLAALLVCLCLAVADPRVYRRQDNTDTASVTSVPSRTRAGEASTTITNRPSESEGNNDEDEEPERESSTITVERNSTMTRTASASRTEAVISAIKSNANGPVATNSNRNGNYSFTATPNTLPLNPEITPAFAVGGILLVLTGAAYTLIGIKNKLVHVFFSAAYLGAVSVTVLILYVMNLPINNAIQGAFLVAITITGLVLGGGATIFTEMTEGLGCLLGGFCFSMWLLVLKPGGLFESQSVTTAIFIAVITISAFGTAFSHYTRTYGLVVGISFGGATVVVLGIDCFTRAGLKEFWAYIWNLNTNLFPVGATSYPVTKGMKVEIAAIIVIFLAGIISQMKLWELIRKRREQREDEQLQNDGLTDLEQAEETVARRIADRILRERNQWEAIYGDKDGVRSSPPRSKRDSGIADVDSQKKGGRSASLRRSEEDAIEMAPVASPKFRTGSGLVMTKSDGGPIIVQVARDHEPLDDIDENDYSTDNQVKRVSDRSTGSPDLDKVEPWAIGEDGKRITLQSSSERAPIAGISEAPKVVALPFRVPESEAGDDDGSSVATFADEERDVHRHSKHLSAGSAILRRLSKISNRSSRTFSKGGGDSSEDLVIPRAVDIEDDRASSMAATVDGLSDDEDMRSIRSSIDQAPNTDESHNIVVHSPTTTTPTINLVTDEPEGIKTRPLSEATEATNILELEPHMKNGVPFVRRSLTSSTDIEGKHADKDEAPTVVSAADSKASITKDRLPPQLSKVVMSYRTNEWAKHLEGAENPELDELKLAEYANERDSRYTEAAAPVDVEALQQTAKTAKPPALRLSNRPPLTRNASKAHPSLYQSRTENSNGNDLDGSLSRNTSQHALNRNILRSSSTPTASSSIVESPIEADFGTSSNPNYGLMGKRDSIVRAKQSYYANGAALASMPEFPRGSGPSSEVGEVYNYPNNSTPAFANDDNISLSARRSLIRQSSLQQTPIPFNSHQPKRQSSTPTPIAREQQLASWRASVTQDLHSGVIPKNSMERSRSALFNERQAEEQKKVMEAKMKAKRESAFDERMRRGDMLDAHRDALRKMQAKANRSVT